MMRFTSIVPDCHFVAIEEDIITSKQFQVEARCPSTEFQTDGGGKYIKSTESLSDGPKSYGLLIFNC